MTAVAPDPRHAPAVLKVHPLNQRCPHCRRNAVLLTGDPATAECGCCGRTWGADAVAAAVARATRKEGKT